MAAKRPPSGRIHSDITCPGARLDRFAALLRRFEPKVHAICRVLTGSEGKAEVFSERVFVELFHSPVDFTLSSSQFLKETLRLVAVHSQTFLADGECPPEFDRGWKDFARLPVEDREIILLRFVGRLEIGDLGGLLGLPDRVVKMRLWEAMNRLRGRHSGEN